MTDQTRGPYRVVHTTGDGFLVVDAKDTPWYETLDREDAELRCVQFNEVHRAGLAAGRAGVAEWLLELAAVYEAKPSSANIYRGDGMREAASAYLREHPVEVVACDCGGRRNNVPHAINCAVNANPGKEAK